MTTLTATNAKSKFLNLLRKAHELGEKFTITNNGEPYAVIMSTDEYEGLLETLAIIKDRRATRELLVSMKEARYGKTVPFEKVVGRKQRK